MGKIKGTKIIPSGESEFFGMAVQQFFYAETSILLSQGSARVRTMLVWSGPETGLDIEKTIPIQVFIDAPAEQLNTITEALRRAVNTSGLDAIEENVYDVFGRTNAPNICWSIDFSYTDAEKLHALIVTTLAKF